MVIMNATKARMNFFQLIRDIDESNEPVVITGKENNAVLISERDWRALEETLYLQSIPGMAKSIREGMSVSEDELLTSEEVWGEDV